MYPCGNKYFPRLQKYYKQCPCNFIITPFSINAVITLEYKLYNIIIFV